MQSTRPAGYNERRCITRDIKGLYGRIVAVGRYEAVLQKASDFQHELTTALQLCIDNTHALRTVVKGSRTKQPVMQELSNVIADNHFTILQPSTQHENEEAVLRRLLHTIHNEPVSQYEDRPQWRVWIAKLVRESKSSAAYMAFACSHVLMDGRSATIFHEKMLNALSTGTVQSSKRLLPALDRMASMPISWSFLLRPLLSELLPSSVARLLGLSTTTDAWTGTRAIPVLEADQLLRTAVRMMSIDAVHVEALLQVLRRNNARMTALLNLALAQSLSSVLLKFGQAHSCFVASTPYDLRKLVPEAQGEMSNCVSAVDERFVVESDTMQLGEAQWKQIQESTALLQERSSTLRDQPVALLSYLSDFHKWVYEKARRPRSESFSISNVGRFAGSSRGVWLISDMVFSQSADATGAVLNINVASGDAGKLNIAITWWPGVLGVEDECAFVDQVCEELSARLAAAAV